MSVSGSAFSLAAALLRLSNNLCKFAYGLTLWEVMELLKVHATIYLKLFAPQNFGFVIIQNIVRWKYSPWQLLPH
jgi:hypothetical protein